MTGNNVSLRAERVNRLTIRQISSDGRPDPLPTPSVRLRPGRCSAPPGIGSAAASRGLTAICGKVRGSLIFEGFSPDRGDGSACTSAPIGAEVKNTPLNGPNSRARRNGFPVAGTVLATLFLAGCGGGPTPLPTAGDSRGAIPDLRDRSVMVLPVQRRASIPADVDREIEFILRERGHEVDWAFEDEIRRALERAPAMDASVRGLPVSAFLQAEVERIGDPLYGQLRRMAALVDTDVVLLPVRARIAPVDAAGATGVELSVALIDVRSGRLFWYGVIGGTPGARDDFATVASAAEALADRVLWFSR